MRAFSHKSLAFAVSLAIIACAVGFGWAPPASGLMLAPFLLGPLQELAPFNGAIPATGKATLDVLGNIAGRVINRLILQLGGGALTKAMLTDIKLRASNEEKGGKPIWETTGARTDSRMQFRGIAANAAFLTLDFTEIRAKTVKGQKLGSVDTRMLKTLSLELVVTGATTPTITPFAEYDEPEDYDALYDAGERALISKVLTQTYNFAAAGTFPMKLGQGTAGGSLIKRIFLHGATVTAVEVRRNGRQWHKSTAALNSFIQTEYGRTPQANIYCIDFIEDGNQSYALNSAAAQSVEYYVTVSGAGNVDVELELYDPLQNN